MPVTGDYHKLERLMGELAAVRALQRPIAKGAERTAVQQYAAGFSGQRDPFGGGWPAAANGESPVLMDTMALANATSTSTAGRVELTTAPYGIFHQAGANGMAVRQILPNRPGSLWEGPIERTINEIVESHFTK